MRTFRPGEWSASPPRKAINPLFAGLSGVPPARAAPQISGTRFRIAPFSAHFHGKLEAGRGTGANFSLTDPDNTHGAAVMVARRGRDGDVGRILSRINAVPIDASRGRPLAVTLVRAGARLGLAGLFMLGANDALQNASA